MRVIQRCRRGGKTYELIQLLKADTGSCLVVNTNVERNRLIRQYELEPTEADRVLVARPHLLHGRSGDVMVDNADWLLATMLGKPVDIITLT